MRPEIWTILKVLNWASDFFETRHIEQPRSTAEILLGHALGLARLDLYVQYDRPLEQRELEAFKALLRRRLDREPVAYIIGEKGFWSLDLTVSPDVLIPRPETEFLVEAALSVLPEDGGGNWKVLDLGTGSGAVVLAMASESTCHRYFAVDVSRAAVAVARENARRHSLADSVAFFCGSWFDAIDVKKGHFHVIVSNPPYVRQDDIQTLSPEISVFEPSLALDGGPDGLDCVRFIVEEATRFLTPGGWLFMEIGYDQWEMVKKMVERNGYQEIRAVKDYGHINRVIQARWPGR